MRIGIVGNGEDKFTSEGKDRAIQRIYELLSPGAIVVSGHSPVGGIDIWAEEAAAELGLDTDIKVPEVQQWNPVGGYGYKARNLDIATTSDVLHVLLADVYPDEYVGKWFRYCYHHKDPADHINPEDHVKSGGCWTGRQALLAEKEVHWHVLKNYPNRSLLRK